MIYVNEKMLKHMKKKGSEFLYLLQIGEVENQKRLIKIGTTNDMHRRMREHHKKYNKDIYVIWCIPLKSKWTTLMKEDSNKETWKNNADWEYLRNDRFYIPSYLKGLSIKVRKTYDIKFDVKCYEYGVDKS